MNSLTTVGARVIDSGLVRKSRRNLAYYPSFEADFYPHIASVDSIDEDRDDCDQHDECGDEHDDSSPSAWSDSRRRRQTPPGKSSLRERPPVDSSSQRRRRSPVSSSSFTTRASGDSAGVIAKLRDVSMIEPYVSSPYFQRIFTSGIRNLEAMSCNVVDVEIALRSCFDINADMIRDITIAAKAIEKENYGDNTTESGENGDNKATGETQMEEDSVNDQSDGTNDLCHRMDRILSSYTEIGCQIDGDIRQSSSSELSVLPATINTITMNDIYNDCTNEFHKRLNRLLSATEMTVGLKRMQKIMILVEQMMIEKEDLKRKYDCELDTARQTYDIELEKARQTLHIRDKQLEQYRRTLDEAELTNSVFEESIRKLECKDVLIRQLANRVRESELMNKNILQSKSDMKREYQATVNALSISIALIQQAVEVTDVHSVLVTSNHQDKMEPTPELAEIKEEENNKYHQIEVGACLLTIVNAVEAKEIERLQTEMRRLEMEFTIAQSSYHNAAALVNTTNTPGIQSQKLPSP